MADALYLAVSNLNGGKAKCFLVDGCDVVLLSKYSEIFGVPLEFFGLAFYLSIFLLSIMYLDKGSQLVSRLIYLISIPAFFFTLYLLYLQTFVIEAFCVYCLFSAVFSTSIFIISIFLRFTKTPSEDIIYSTNGAEEGK
jgi:uncharacterized membrane protein